MSDVADERAATLTGVLIRAATNILDLRAVGADSDLRTLGLDSLGALRLVGYLLASNGISIRADTVLRLRTPAAIAVAAAAQPEPRPVSVAAGLTPHQIDMWMDSHLCSDSGLGNVLLFGYRLRGAVRASRLAAAIRGVVERHVALRTAIQMDRTATPVAVELPVADALSVSVSRDTDTDTDDGRVVGRLARIVDVSVGPILAADIRTGPRRTDLLIAVHHTAFDGHSRARFVSDLCALARRQALPPAVPFRPQANQAHNIEEVSQWAQRLAAADVITWPHRPATTIDPYALLTDCLPESSTSTLRAEARDEAVTPFLVTLRRFGRAVRYATGATHFRVCVPTSGRDDPSMLDAIGYLVRPVVVPLGERELDGPIAALEQTWERAQTLSDVPISHFVRAMWHVRRPSGPVFQVEFAWQGLPPAAWDLPGVDTEELHIVPLAPQCEMSLEIVPQPTGQLVTSLGYDTRVVSRAAAEAVRDAFHAATPGPKPPTMSQ